MTLTDDDVFGVELDLEALNEVRKTLSITMTKLEAKLQKMDPNSRIHLDTVRTYRALKRAYGEVIAAIEEASGL